MPDPINYLIQNIEAKMELKFDNTRLKDEKDRLSNKVFKLERELHEERIKKPTDAQEQVVVLEERVRKLNCTITKLVSSNTSLRNKLRAAERKIKRPNERSSDWKARASSTTKSFFTGVGMHQVSTPCECSRPSTKEEACHTISNW